MWENNYLVFFSLKKLFSGEIVEVGIVSNSFDLHSNLHILVNVIKIYLFVIAENRALEEAF